MKRIKFINKSQIFVIYIIILSFCFSSIAQARIYYISQDGSGIGDGSSWSNALRGYFLQDQLNRSSPGDIFYVAAGIYKPIKDIVDREKSFNIKAGLKLYGGFSGTETGSHEQMLNMRNLQKNKTVLSGDIDNNDIVDSAGITLTIKGANSYHILIGGAEATSVDTEINGFYITGGHALAMPDAEDEKGGGMYNDNSSPAVTNCAFIGNTARIGAGMYNTTSSPLVTNCMFTNNVTSTNRGDENGGGMHNRVNSNPIIINCTFSKNLAHLSGAGIFNIQSNPLVINCTFYDNLIVDWYWSKLPGGAGMYNRDSKPVVVNSTFSRNRLKHPYKKTFGAGQVGAGMYNYNSYSVVVNCIFWDNFSGDDLPCPIYNSYEDRSSFSYCVIEYSNADRFSGAGNAFTNPIMRPLMDNGGLMPTCAISAAGSAYRSGTNTLLINGKNVIPTTDQRGIARTNGIDIGAYQRIQLTNRHKSYYVTKKGAGDKTGKNWENALDDSLFCFYLENAEAESAFTFYVAKGVYRPTSDKKDRKATFILNSDVKIYGGFSGTETGTHEQLLAQRNIPENKTILSGDIDANDLKDIYGITEKYDNILGENSYHVVTTEEGADSKTTEINGFYIISGQANGGKNYYDPLSNGGGIYNFNTNPTVANCTFSGNTSSGGGGGIYNHSSSPVITDCTFNGGNGEKYGGGIYNNSNSNPTITNCTFSGNNSNWGGGGIYSVYSNPTITNCTFNENKALYGGGVFSENTSKSVITNCTFVKNSSSYGGGLFGSEQSYVTNCIFWENSAQTDPQLNNVGGITYCVIQDGSEAVFSGTGNVFTDPLLAPLNDNGGLTQTCAIEEAGSAYQSGAKTLIIDGKEFIPTTDQRNKKRGTLIDIGAFQLSEVSIHNNSDNFMISDIIPMPVRHEAYFKLSSRANGKLSVSIYDFTGKKLFDIIKDEFVTADSELVIPLEVQNLANGVYTIMITIGNEKLMRQMIITK